MPNSPIWPIDRTLSRATSPSLMVIKGYSLFHKAPALLKHHHQIVLYHIRTLVGRVLPFCKDAVGLFCCHSRLGQFLPFSRAIVRSKIQTAQSRFLHASPISFPSAIDVPLSTPYPPQKTIKKQLYFASKLTLYQVLPMREVFGKFKCFVYFWFALA